MDTKYDHKKTAPQQDDCFSYIIYLLSYAAAFFDFLSSNTA